MRILAIRGCNMASLEGEFAIDFTAEPLASAGIFAISGPTGSGKSTLLDVMCLALFARTPRTEQARERQVWLCDVAEDKLTQNDARFLLRRGTALGYAEVDFVALNGHRYRSRWSVSRARNKENGRLKAAQMSLLNLDNEQEEKGKISDLQARIVELIGLTFEQFTRSVLLAQNDFSTFLKAEQSEKASLLEKLTGTELYSKISQAIYTKNVEAKAAFEQVNNQVQGVELLSEEAVESFLAQDRTAQEALDKLEKDKGEWKHLNDSIASFKVQQTEKERQQVTFSDLLKRANDALEDSKQSKEKVTQALAKENEATPVLRQQLQQVRILDAEIQAVQKVENDSRKLLNEAEKKRKDAENKLSSSKNKQQKALKEYNDLFAWFDKYKGKENAAEQLSTLLLHLDASLTAREAIRQADINIDGLRDHLKKVEISKQTVSENLRAHVKSQAAIDAEKQDINKKIEGLNPEVIETKRGEWNTKRETLLLEQARFMATGSVKDLRERLVEKTPCPVCGSLEHPYATHEAQVHLMELATQIAEATAALEQLKAQAVDYENLRKRFVVLQQNDIHLRSLKAEDEKVLVDLKKTAQVITEKIERELKEKSNFQNNLSRSLSAANDLFGHENWQKKWAESPNDFTRQLEDFANRWRSNKERLRVLDTEKSANQAECELCASLLPPLVKDYEKASRQLEEKQSYLRDLITQRNLYFQGASADEVEKNHNQKIQDLQNRLNLIQEQVTKQTGEVEKNRGLSELNTQGLKDINARLEDEQRKLMAWQKDYELRSEGLSLEESIRKYTNQKTEAQFCLRKNEENKKRIASLQEDLRLLGDKSEQWAKLNEIAGSADGGKFRRIAQGYTLDLLLGYANVQLRQLTRRYRLERVPETLALQVIDQDMCDEIRTVHSLSGGESFLVSLALALGLSSLSSNRMKVESLFIDEGFGSLDAETLRVAMDALESLRTQGRKIGVISHVQEMTERVPVQIQVIRAGNGRSYLNVL